MHLSTAGQLAHPAEDGGRRTGRHGYIIVTNGHGLPGREQSDNGGVRPCDDRRMDRYMGLYDGIWVSRNCRKDSIGVTKLPRCGHGLCAWK